MKKVLLFVCFLIATATMVSAQRAAERKAQISKGLKEQVQLTDAQIESVMGIEAEFRPRVRAISTDSTMSDADKKSKHKALNEEKKAKIEAAVGKENAVKVESFYSSLKKEDKGPKVDGADDKAKKGGGKKEKGSGNK
jgi:Skp family chaperone for outer membrane proteins